MVVLHASDGDLLCPCDCDWCDGAGVWSATLLLWKKTVKQTLDDAQQGCMIVLYLVHPTILSEVVRALPCDAVAGTGTKYLRADMSIDCRSREYRVHLIHFVALSLYFTCLG